MKLPIQVPEWSVFVMWFVGALTCYVYLQVFERENFADNPNEPPGFDVFVATLWPLWAAALLIFSPFITVYLIGKLMMWKRLHRAMRIMLADSIAYAQSWVPSSGTLSRRTW